MQFGFQRSVLLGFLMLGALSIHAATGIDDGNSLMLTINTEQGRGSREGVIDAGTIRNPHGRKVRPAIVTRTFSIHIDRKSGERGGTATLRAFLASPDPYLVYRIDGMVLGTQPMVIDRLAPIGNEAFHRLEIEVPPTAPEGTLFTSIEWELTTD